ncbi:MAG: L-2-amino-thiazoline-4-carboxylic acid hydrolase [Anaerolineales bacterium]|nr:L-2-amino-thiazoline-4-carboxylic acid hydrolase [Anaerolineales bacterium]
MLLRRSKRRMPKAAAFQRLLAAQRGVAGAATLLAKAEQRYWEQYAARARFEQRALADHLENNLLPGLALYQALQADGLEPTAACQLVQALLAAASLDRLRKPIQWLGRLPQPFPVFRWAVRQMMKVNFPEGGWKTEWLEDNDQRVAFNLHSCFYLDVLTAYGAPELTLAYCALDDLMYEPPPAYLAWERTTTLARGGEYCDFAWRNLLYHSPEEA